jgi:hypothetical protein
MSIPPLTFRRGDRVTWASQAGGHVTTKTGTVVAVVPAGVSPFAVSWRMNLRARFDGDPRPHESYVVRVADSAYWPRVAWLRREEPA